MGILLLDRAQLEIKSEGESLALYEAGTTTVLMSPRQTRRIAMRAGPAAQACGAFFFGRVRRNSLLTTRNKAEPTQKTAVCTAKVNHKTIANNDHFTLG